MKFTTTMVTSGRPEDEADDPDDHRRDGRSTDVASHSSRRSGPQTHLTTRRLWITDRRRQPSRAEAGSSTPQLKSGSRRALSRPTPPVTLPKEPWTTPSDDRHIADQAVTLPTSRQPADQTPENGQQPSSADRRALVFVLGKVVMGVGLVGTAETVPVGGW